MNRPSVSRRSAACMLLVAAGTFTAAAGAGVPVVPERWTMQNAVADCQGALPAFEGAIRKRPTGMANEGTGNAFLTCSMQGEFVTLPAANTWFGVSISNRAAEPVTVSCTAVLGITGLQTFLTKTVTVPPGNGRRDVSWAASVDNGNVPYGGPVNFSCALVPGSEASYTFRRFYIDET